MEDDRFVLHGPEPAQPVPTDTLGTIIFNSLLDYQANHDAMFDVFTGKAISYNTILEEACNLAEALRKYGCNTDTVVSICSENNLEFYIPVFASLFAGTIMAPMNPIYAVDEMKHALNITKPKIIFASQMIAPRFMHLKHEMKFVEKIIVFDTDKQVVGAQNLKEFLNEQLRGQRVLPHNFRPFDGDARKHIAFIMCSSGTTGLPKGVMLSHTALAIRIAQSRDPRYKRQDSDNKTEIVIGIMPFFHSYGLNLGISTIINKHIIVVFKKFDEDVYLKAIQDYKVTILNLAPPLAVFLAKTPKLAKYDTSSVTAVFCGAAPLSKQVEDVLKKRLNVNTILQAYGLTESNLAVTIMDEDAVKSGSCGRVISYMTVKLRDPETRKSLGPNKIGEICIKGPQVMMGYYNNEQATKEAFTSDGWLRTGDMGYYDDQGYFYIVDRLKELIKYKGYQVAPAELEAILLSHPDVVDVGVVGLPDEKAGELPVAFVVRRSENITENQLQEFVASKKSVTAKRLRGGVIFVSAIPKNASGKILRKDLRKQLDNYKAPHESKL